jgi:flagellar basal-body rod modification protein FlgD
MSTTPSVSGYTVNAASSGQLSSSTQSAQQLKDEFLQMLMAQLKNQDPTNPVDSTQMLSQQAQFSALEQMQNLNTNFVSLMAMQNVSQATNLIGRTVTGAADGSAPNAAPVSGVVTGVSFANGSPVLTVNVSGTAVQMSLSNVTQVNQ